MARKQKDKEAMDFATLAGLILAWGALAVALMIEGGHFGDLVNASAFVIVIGGTAGATVISLPTSQVRNVYTIAKQAFFAPKEDVVAIISTVVQFGRLARREGILALEADTEKLDNRFLRRGLQLVIDGTPSELIREILETEIAAMEERHKAGQGIFSMMGGYAPTLGIIGTVLGLVHMLASLSEPGKMGSGIAAAFIATLYGVSTANLIFLPISGKLKVRTEEEAAVYQMVIEGILAIQAGESPRMIEMKMTAFLPPTIRETIAGEYGGLK